MAIGARSQSARTYLEKHLKNVNTKINSIERRLSRLERNPFESEDEEKNEKHIFNERNRCCSNCNCNRIICYSVVSR